MKTKLAAWIVLGVIAVFAAACLGATNEITKDVIAEQTARAAEEARRGLVTEAETFEELALAEDSGADYCYEGRAADGTPVGYVAQVTVQGYGGPVEVIVGTDAEGVLTGIEVGGASFAETAGLGAKAKEEAFTGQFVGKTTPLALGDGENDIDAITAATITSNAVLRAVNTAVEEIGGFAGFEIASTASGGEIGEGRYAASVNGFAGPVYVEIQLDENNVITEIVIGDDQFAETAGYGEQAKEPAFYEQFLGKTGQLTLGTDIDAISGATITSQAVVDAVNMAMLYATDPEAAAAANAPQEFVLPDVPEGALTSSASSKGFGGPVEASITVDTDGTTLLRVEFGGEKWAETDGIGTRILEDAFWQQFIGKTLPLAEGDVDVIAGATVSSEAAINAVNKAYYKLFPEAEPAKEETVEASAEEAPAEETSVPASGTAEASSKGYGGPVAASITVEDGVLTAVTFGSDSFAETEGLGTKVLEEDFAAQFIGKTLPLAEGDVDVIAGATVSSEAAINAVNKAYYKLFPEAEPAKEETVEASAEEAPAEETGVPASGTAEASSKGYGGPVAASITVEDGVLTAVTFGSDSFAETEGLGTKVLEEDFAAQFIGKALPLAEGDVDVIAGATVSSEAAISAVNKAYEKLQAAAAEEAPAEEAPAEETGAPASGTAEASSKGYGGPVAASITVEDGVLTAVTFGSDSFAETEGLGTKVLEEDFAAQFIGKALPLAEGDVDVIAGATVSSEAAISAVNKAYEKLLGQ